MKPISGKEFAKIIERRGWRLMRISGSHHIYCKAGSQIRLSIPIHRNQDLKLGLQKHLLKLAEVDEDEL